MVDTIVEACASTKTQGRGMGLKICRTLIELHRGHLMHRRAEGGGTIFSVSIPLADVGYSKQEELEDV